VAGYQQIRKNKHERYHSFSRYSLEKLFNQFEQNNYKKGSQMKIKNIISIMVTILFLLINGNAHCDNGLSYDDTVYLIKKTMVDSTSDYRKESYGYIRFNKCSLDYNVSGTYPVGDLYNIKFSNIDFASLNYKESRVGQDYTDFIILNFNNYVRYNDNVKDIPIRTVVVNISTDEKAQLLFKAFLHLGELCGAQKSPK
jgi:hypothetical protein